MATTALIIDDEEDYRLIVCEILRGSGFEVRAAADGEEALRLLKERPADIVIVDWLMPRMDGERFCRIVRAEPELKDIPLIMLTVRRTADEELEALDFGVDDFLVKPVQADELMARVRAVLRRAADRRA